MIDSSDESDVVSARRATNTRRVILHDDSSDAESSVHGERSAAAQNRSQSAPMSDHLQYENLDDTFAAMEDYSGSESQSDSTNNDNSIRNGSPVSLPRRDGQSQNGGRNRTRRPQRIMIDSEDDTVE